METTSVLAGTSWGTAAPLFRWSMEVRGGGVEYGGEVGRDGVWEVREGGLEYGGEMRDGGTDV